MTTIKQKTKGVNMFDFFDDAVSGITDTVTSGLTIVVGENRIENVFTIAGEMLGDGWEVAGKALDHITEDIEIDLGNIF
jgi:hypothetical protein